MVGRGRLDFKGCGLRFGGGERGRGVFFLFSSMSGGSFFFFRYYTTAAGFAVGFSCFYFRFIRRL